MMTLVITALASVVLTWGISTISQTRSQLSGAINARAVRLSESTVIEDVQLIAGGTSSCPPAGPACLEIWIRNTGSTQSVIDQVYVNNLAMTPIGTCLNVGGTLCTPSATAPKLSLPIQGVGAFEVSYSGSIPLVTGSASIACTPCTTLTDSSKSWNNNQWLNFYLKIVLGTGSSPTYYPISANTSTTLTISIPSLDLTSQYAISCGTPTVATPFCRGATYTVAASTTRGTLATGAFTV